jgi:penicillin-binding protein-related factor A (putative recombinase)
MSRKQSEKELGQLIRSLGGDWKKFEDRRSCPHCHQLIYRVDNQPFDGIGTINSISFPIEVKSGKLTFPFADIKPHQRAGLADWMKKHGNSAWLCLQMGNQRVNATQSKAPRKMWLIAWDDWVDFEDLIKTQGLKSLPYSFETSNRVVVRDLRLGAVDLLANHELTWSKKGWVLPPLHSFRYHYLKRTYGVSEDYDPNTDRQLVVT